MTAIDVFDHGGAAPRHAVAAGQIAKVRGLGDVRIGDTIGAPPAAPPAPHHFAPPILETVVAPRRRADRAALRVALGRLADQDPLIGLRQDEVRGELSVVLYGEVQKEVIQATLADDFGIDVAFRASTTICIERPAGTGAAVELIATDPNPFLATVGLRIDPAPAAGGVEFGLEVELGSMPLSFFTAVEETVRETLRQGPRGWDVTGCRVTMTHSGYWAKQSSGHAAFDKSMSSTARDFRRLSPLVVMSALAQAGTTVHEPVHRFRLELPADALAAVLAVLGRLGAVTGGPSVGGSASALEGRIPAARVDELRRRLPGLTRGEGMLETTFDGYEPARGAVPARPRTDDDPLDRDAYVRRVTGRW